MHMMTSQKSDTNAMSAAMNVQAKGKSSQRAGRILEKAGARKKNYTAYQHLLCISKGLPNMIPNKIQKDRKVLWSTMMFPKMLPQYLIAELHTS